MRSDGDIKRRSEWGDGEDEGCTEESPRGWGECGGGC